MPRDFQLKYVGLPKSDEHQLVVGWTLGKGGLHTFSKSVEPHRRFRSDREFRLDLRNSNGVSMSGKRLHFRMQFRSNREMRWCLLVIITLASLFVKC
ncbi:MAG: hypothetical protein U0936_22685 [Planctomycetaceae bacterium]